MLSGLSDFPRVRWDSQTNCGFLQRNHCSHSQGKKMPGVYGQQNWNRGLPALGRGPETGVMQEMGSKFLESKPIDPTVFSESGSRPWPGLAWLLSDSRSSRVRQTLPAFLGGGHPWPQPAPGYMLHIDIQPKWLSFWELQVISRGQECSINKITFPAFQFSNLFIS